MSRVVHGFNRETTAQSFTEKYRPTRFAEILGQPNAVKIMRAFVAAPESTGLLFCGDSLLQFHGQREGRC